ncbi:pyridoxamine 5'-phosphate oxidase family protein [Sphingomicrobium astaxanthinifaciens]|uniref:pyridoxamine 5'-phosphate oxidase family protein n=1 Tax=Sphingomicrobium astaxanthinifaciens TaxID=1227949 RepID=UPI001FCB58E0|nr:pyridoxamine 5'-phosphate oxidase family protein [Sphingomicrobium astaxanthinifaciens]MCJ7422377.1 pyridoxamine 5'-phosphate oxidase family protein [Sphingomicrobium astaxanthinifaciens]
MTRPDTLEAILADALDRLEAGARDRRHAMHLPIVATADADARVMVLRAVDREAVTLRFHTDVRAPKVAVLAADPRIGLLAYDREAKVQLRMRGTGMIATQGEEVEAAWAASSNFARRCYLAPHPPSSAHPAPLPNLPADVRETEPDPARLAAQARDQFAILKVELEEIDWFSLAHDGHRRALWRRDGRSTWLAP